MAEKIRLAYKLYEEYMHNNPTNRERFIESADRTYLKSPQSKLFTVGRASYYRRRHRSKRYVQREGIWYTNVADDVWNEYSNKEICLINDIYTTIVRHWSCDNGSVDGMKQSQG